MKKFFAVISICLCAIGCFSQSVILNELVAKNVYSYVTFDNTSPDWIEVKNVSSASANLSDYSIATSKNYDSPVKLPGVSLAPSKCYLLLTNNGVFSGKNEMPLDASAGTVYLFHKSKAVDSISWKHLPTDVSIGRDADNTQCYYFARTTPGKANSMERYVAKTLDKPKLNKPSGLYKSPFYVNAYTSESKSILRYTIDGSVPTEQSMVVSDSIKIIDNTNLRVRAFRDGYLPSETVTMSYLFVQSQTLPIASLTVNNDDFFSDETGIYAEGLNADEEEPHYGANYWQDWERPVHLDYFDENGVCVVSQDLGCKIGGNWSRAQPQKTLKLYARDEYGKDEIEYQFYKDKPISSFHMILLRNSGNDCNNTQMRDGVISVLAKQMDIDRQAYQPAVVYINGEYYGIQNVREKQNKQYVAENFGYDKDDIDVIKSWGEIVDGDDSDYWGMKYFFENTDLSIDKNYQRAKTYIDIPNFIDYNVLEMFVVNEDWPGNNIAYWHSRSANTPWRYMLFDADFGLGIWDLEPKVNKNMLEWCTMEGSEDYATADWATIILRQLLKNKDFTCDFLNATADRLNTTLSPDSVTYVIDSIYSLIEHEMPNHIDRWGYNWQDGWLSQMYDFGRRREAIMRKQTEDFFNTEGSYVLSLNSSDAQAGYIHLNTIDICSFPWSGKYFNNNKISLTAIPRPGYEFARWEGSVNSTERTISVTTDETTELKAVFNYVGNEPNLSFSEVYYHTRDKAETEWIELYNGGDEVDMSHWKLIVDRYNQTYTIPEGTIIHGGQVLVLANNVEIFKQNNSVDDALLLGNLCFDFPKDFATLLLQDSNGNTIAKMAYTDLYPTARKSDGYGYSFEYLYDWEQEENLKWHSCSFGGTPGKINGDDGSNAIAQPVITEINYASSGKLDAGDWIEIKNPSTISEINLKDWMICDKAGNISVIYDDVVIPPQGYVVFADEPEKFHSVYPEVQCCQLDLSLNNYVDEVNLYDSYERRIDAVSYSMFSSSWTKSAMGTGRTLSFIETSDDNSFAGNWLASKSAGTPGMPNDYLQSVPIVESYSTVFPNPCQNYVVVRQNGKFNYEIVTEDGQIVQTGTGVDEKYVLLQVQAGNYFVVVGNEQYKSIHRLIVLKE